MGSGSPEPILFLIFRGRVFDPPLGFLLEPFVPLLFISIG